MFLTSRAGPSRPSSIRKASGRRRPTTRLRIESLEDRFVPSATLVADIVPGVASSDPQNLTNVNGTLYFASRGELWKSDGTTGGTGLVKTNDDFGSIGAPGAFRAVNGGTLFNVRGSGLWKTNGTLSGTSKLKSLDIFPPEESVFYRIPVVNGRTFFSGGDGRYGHELWTSDGTVNGTRIVKDIYTGTGNSSDPWWLTDVNGTLFFSANDGKHGRELWKSDGTERGTALVKDITKGQVGSDPVYPTAVGGTLFFGAAGGLWKTDGTSAGTGQLRAFASSPRGLTNVNGTLFFNAAGELWKSDGTAAGTVQVVAVSVANDPRALTSVGGALFFNAASNGNGRELWKSDGTTGETFQLKDINPGAADSTPGGPVQGDQFDSRSGLINVNGLVYFAADDGVNGRELWQSDGTTAGTRMVQDINPGGISSSPAFLVGMNNKLYFAATDLDHGRELWDPPPVDPPGDRMTLVSNWHEHDHVYADVWGQRIDSGPFTGDYAYLGHFANQGGIDIINVTDPAHPVLASTFLGTGGDNELVDVQVENNIGYFASNTDVTGGIYIVDVSNPYAPRQLTRIDASNGGFPRVHTFYVDGRYLYEVHPNNAYPEIRVFDVYDPTHPYFVRSIRDSFGVGIHEVTVRNGRLFTASFHSPDHVDIFDVSHIGDLSRPVRLLGTIHSGDGTHTALATEDGRFVVVTSEVQGHPLKIYDISNPARPTVASTINVPRAQGYTAHQPEIVGNLLYVAWYEAGVRVYDITNPYRPALLGFYDTYTGPYGEEGECAVNPHGVNSDFEPFPVGCGAWGVYPFLGNGRILVSDIDRGLFIVSLDDPPQTLEAAAVAPDPVSDRLRPHQLRPALTKAIHRWQAHGVDTSGLGSIDIRIANLGGATLGLASGRTIWLDDNAAGWGWFVDSTPWDDSEFTTRGNQGEQNRMDFLTVVMHELGHVLGHEHDAHGVMAETLAAGVRRTGLAYDDAGLAEHVFGGADDYLADAWLAAWAWEQFEWAQPVEHAPIPGGVHQAAIAKVFHIKVSSTFRC